MGDNVRPRSLMDQPIIKIKVEAENTTNTTGNFFEGMLPMDQLTAQCMIARSETVGDFNIYLSELDSKRESEDWSSRLLN